MYPQSEIIKRLQAYGMDRRLPRPTLEQGLSVHARAPGCTCARAWASVCACACVYKSLRAHCCGAGSASERLEERLEGCGNFEFKSCESAFVHLRVLSLPLFLPQRESGNWLFLEGRIWCYACWKYVFTSHFFSSFSEHVFVMKRNHLIKYQNFRVIWELKTQGVSLVWGGFAEWILFRLSR